MGAPPRSDLGMAGMTTHVCPSLVAHAPAEVGESDCYESASPCTDMEPSALIMISLVAIGR